MELGLSSRAGVPQRPCSVPHLPHCAARERHLRALAHPPSFWTNSATDSRHVDSTSSHSAASSELSAVTRASAIRARADRFGSADGCVRSIHPVADSLYGDL